MLYFILSPQYSVKNFNELQHREDNFPSFFKPIFIITIIKNPVIYINEYKLNIQHENLKKRFTFTHEESSVSCSQSPSLRMRNYVIKIIFPIEVLPKIRTMDGQNRAFSDILVINRTIK